MNQPNKLLSTLLIIVGVLMFSVVFAQTPPSGDSANVIITPPSGDNNNTGGTSPTPPSGDNNNTGGIVNPPVMPPADNPQPSGGGSIILYLTTPCSNVVYEEWSAPINGYQYRDIINQIPAGCNFTASQQEARSRKYPPVVNPQILGVKDYADGSLLRGPDWKIYIIIDGRKQFVKNWGELYKKYGGQNINNVSFEVLAQYPEILGVKDYADGSLLRGLDKKVYLIVYGRKLRIKNLKELANYQGREINDISYEVLAQYPEVLGVKVYATGNLLRGSDKKVYLIIDGKRKLIKNLQELINYRGREIINVDGRALESYPLI